MSSFAGRLVLAAAPLCLLTFWGSLLLAAERYPSEFDWRYMTISNLVSAAGNPAGHLLASLGIAACGIGIWCSAAQWKPGRNPKVSPASPTTIWALRAGVLCMVIAATVPQSVLRVPKGHEILALLAFFGLCVAIVRLTYQAIARRGPDTTGQGSYGTRLYAGVVAGTALLPVVIAALAQLYVDVALPQLRWVGLDWRDAGIPAYLSFAFWEWVTCAIFSGYLLMLSRLFQGR
ncbi:MAG TPA: hypothetical protein VF848_06140 [Steroidobacteraceae bacterium]